MGGAQIWRVTVHAMWLTVVVAIPVFLIVTLVASATDHDPDFGRGFDGAVLAAVVLAPWWMPVAALLGAVFGLAGAGAGRLLQQRGARASAVAATLAGGLTGLGVTLAAMLGLGVSGVTAWVTGGIAVGIGAIASGGGNLLARRGEITRGGAGIWGVAALILALGAVGLGSWTSFFGQPWDAVESCAGRLGLDDAAMTVVFTEYPRQAWCVSADLLLRWDTSWWPAVPGITLAAAVACAMVAVGRSKVGSRWLPAVWVVATATGLVGAGAAIWLAQLPPSEAEVAQAREGIRQELAAPVQPPAGPTPVPAQPRAANVRRDMAELITLARTGAGPGVLWSKRPDTTEARCVLPAGERGVILTMSASFTTRALADVHGPDEMLALEKANEEVAARIAGQWGASGPLSNGELIHGEWVFGPGTATGIETAHLGFTNGIGDLRITSSCVAR